MEMTVKLVVEFSPEALTVLNGLVSAVGGKVEAQCKCVETEPCDQKDEAPTADTEPVKTARKPRAKKAKMPVSEEVAIDTVDTPEDKPAEESDPYTTEQVTQVAFKAFEKLSNDPETPVSAEALTLKVRELVLGDKDAEGVATIPALDAKGRIAFMEYCRSAEVGCAEIVEQVLSNA